MSHLSFLKRLVPIIFYGLLAVFLVIYLQHIDYDKFANIRIHWYYLAIATGIGLAFRFWGAYVWISLLRLLGAHNAFYNPAFIYVYAKSWLGRYIPGSAAWILGKIYFAAQHGVSKNKLAVSALLEAALQIIIQMIIALIVLGLDPRLHVINVQLKVLMAVTTLLLACLLIPSIFNRLISFAYRIVKRKTFPQEHLSTNRIVTRGAGLFSIATVINSFSFYFVALSIYPDLGTENILFVMGASTLAGAASMLAVFAPSGLGVREGIQLALLSIIMPTEFALAITVFTRLWSIGVDFLFYAGASFLNHRFRSTA